MAGIGVLLSIMWALITYVVPDPSIFGFSFISWKNVVLLVCAFLFMGAVSIGWQIRNLTRLLRGLLQFCIVAVVSVGFFTLGSEYAKPSFEFAKLQARVVENDGSNLLGKRLEVLDNVRIELQGCENLGHIPACTFELTSLGMDRGFRFDDGTRLFDESGGPLKLTSARVGQVETNSWSSFPLIRNVPARVTMMFQPSNNKLSKTPAVKLMFSDTSSNLLTLKFSDVEMR